MTEFAAPSHIVVPLDSSELAERAVPWAGFLARQAGVPVVLIAVWTPYDPLPGIDYLGATAEIERQVQAYLEGVAASDALAGLDVACEVRHGSVVDEITSLVRELANPLVVVSTHGRSGFKRLFLGSVTDKLLRSLGVPILVIPAGRPDEQTT
ncbi:MAG: universal stress protein [Dehalococcoidia bacterium]